MIYIIDQTIIPNNFLILKGNSHPLILESWEISGKRSAKEDSREREERWEPDRSRLKDWSSELIDVCFEELIFTIWGALFFILHFFKGLQITAIVYLAVIWRPAIILMLTVFVLIYGYLFVIKNWQKPERCPYS